MARPPRIDYPNAVYHVTSRGNARGVIFWSHDDHQRFLAQLADSLHTLGVQLYAFVLMENHLHLLVKTPRANLSRFMQRLLTRYALYSPIVSDQGLSAPFIGRSRRTGKTFSLL